MNRPAFLLVLALLSTCAAPGEDFRRKMPDAQLLEKITPERFVNQDAVIVLKEQGFSLLNTDFFYKGAEFEGLSTFHMKVMIVKVLTQAGVGRYGTFSYRYPEWFGDEIPNGFKVLARVRKPDGSIEDVESDDMKPKVSRRDKDGDPLERSVIFKIPNLAPGDVLQLEYEAKEAFTVSRSAVFFYDEPDLVLFSNLFITLPMDAQAEYTSLPEQRIGKPQVQQLDQTLGAGETYFWSVRNVPPLPREPYAPPFTDQAMLTSFAIRQFGINGSVIGGWPSLAERFYNWRLDGSTVGNAILETMGMPKSPGPGGVTKGLLDSLYTSLRRAVRVTRTSDLSPQSGKIESIFEDKKGDASDLSYAMYTILQKWGVPVSVAWMRDRRNGGYEESIPTLSWFDRLAVVATAGEKEYLYDFDASVPVRYQTPWYVKGVKLPVLTAEKIAHRVVVPVTGEGDDVIEERHHLFLDGSGPAVDSVAIAIEGSEANQFRLDQYGVEESALKDVIREAVRPSISAMTQCSHKSIVEEPVLHFTATGDYAGRIDSVDNRRTLSLTNTYLTRLRDRLSTPKRVNHITFPSPMTVRLRWEVHLPRGYQLEKGIDNRTIHGPRGAQFVGTMRDSAQFVVAEGVLKIPEKNYPRNDHGELVNFLDESLKLIGADIILKKETILKRK